ncbi:hypothetical protein HYFRA_00006987 [Hymenoscyphus fraxineus]|uniref:RNA helicase n=1 Tax=Hymenoscyphus fraxineus TaxID=746836 RepID=A0A9N9KQX2_9HELO|nr:hypothetical protein HYFRA_00006987 [Hymenoscyphus fraxineus]
MPPKLHMKFGGDSEPAPVPAPASSTSKHSSKKNDVSNKSTKQQSTSNASKPSSTVSQNNGLKRSQDGNPKTNTPSESQTSHKSEHDDSGRARKSPKLSSLDSKKSETRAPHKPGAKANDTQNAKVPYNGPSSQELQKAAKELEKIRMRLPVYHKKNDIRWDLRNNDILIINGETGSGKSTQIPQFLYTEPWCQKKLVTVEESDGTKKEINVGGMIAVTQPRRIAAMTLAQRVAAEMGSPLSKGSIRAGQPGTVGYSVRFDNQVPNGAKIKFVTEGILLQEMLSDPNLRKYSAIMIDEIHERSMDVDLIAGFLRRLVHGDLKGRGGVPLKLVIMSATLDQGGVEAFFAKPNTRPDYVPGQNHGRVIAPDLIEQMALRNNGAQIPVKAAEEEPDNRRSSTDTTFSSWSGITDSTVASQDAGKQQSTQDSTQSNTQSGANTLKNEDRPLSRPGILEEDISPTGVAYQYIAGRQYEVKTFYEHEPKEDYVHAMLEVILMLHTQEPLPGDILAFLTGQEEIEALQAELEKYSQMLIAAVPRMEIKPLHGSLTPDQQKDAFVKVEKRFTRKVVLATNIAETSLTVAGVHYVVDGGKAKVKQYRPHLGMETLLIKPISKVAAVQRLGRAGREAVGKCYRIYTKADFKEMDEDEKPEILRCNVIEAVLKMKARGINDVLDFPLMDSPDVVYMEKALNQLYAMGALQPDGSLTKNGKAMAKLPLPATHGCVLIAAADESADCLLEVIDILACLNTDQEIFLHPKSIEEQEEMSNTRADIYRREGDLITLLTTMQRYAADNTNRRVWCESHLISVRAMTMANAVRKQLRMQCVKLKLLKENPPADPQPFEPVTPERAEIIMKVFLKAFVRETAIMGPDGSYKTTNGKETIQIHPSSVLHGKKLEAIMFLQHVYTNKNYAKKVSSIQANWIAEQYALC